MKQAVHAKIKEFYASQGFSPQFQTKDGKKEEVEYDKEYGQQNAIHILMRHPDYQIYNYLVQTCKIPFDEMDFKKRNPFTIGVDFSMIPRSEKEMGQEMKNLVERGANFDLADDSG